MITQTGLQIVTDTLMKLGIYAPGETPPDSDVEQGISTLNDMLDSWANEFLFVNQITPTTIPLVFSVQTYFIGQAGTASPQINQERPKLITYGQGAATFTNSGATIVQPVNVVGRVQWQQIANLANGLNLGIPDTLWYDAQYPIGALNVAPIPSGAAGGGTLVFQALYPLISMALPTSYNLAEGTSSALKNNLAVRLKTYFGDAPVPPAIAEKAMIDKAYLRQISISSKSLLSRSQIEVLAK